MKGKTRAGRNSEKTDWGWLTRIVGSLLVLIIVRMVGRHDFYGQAVTFNLWDNIPEDERASPELFTPWLRAKQGVDIITRPITFTPVTRSQLSCSLAQDAFHATSRQVRDRKRAVKGMRVGA